MGPFGSMSLGTKFGIILGILIAMAFAAGLLKLYVNRRRLKKKAKTANEEAAAMKTNDKEKLVGKYLEEGSLVGGVAHERSNSPVPSYILSPSTTVTNWSKAGKNSFHSTSSSVVDLQESRTGSVSSLLAAPQPAKTKPSPHRLNPFGTELNGSRNHSPTNSVGGLYMPPLPPPTSVRSFTNPQAENGWVSPMDVHFSRPTTANASATSTRPQSYLPRLQFPEELGKSALIVFTPSGSVVAINSETSSIVSSDAIVPPQNKESLRDNSHYSNSSPKDMPYQASQESHSRFHTNSDDERPSSRRGTKDFKQSLFPIPPLPQSYFDPSPSGLTAVQFGERAVIRESIVSKRSVSVFQPQRTQRPSPDTSIYAHSRQSSSVYSATPSMVGTSQGINQHSRTRSHSIESQAEFRSQSRPISSKQPKHSQGLSRTQDSLRHSHKTSQSENRQSREHDEMHYDLTSNHWNRSGSVQDRNADFDHPRESPFSHANAVSNYSASSSISFSPSSETSWQKQEVIHKPNLGLNLPEPDRLSVMTGGRGRSGSETSQGSIGEFYDAYFRQSILTQRASVASQVQMINSNAKGEGQELMGVGDVLGEGGNGNLRRPAPPKLEAVGLVGETIVEVLTPAPSPMARERFPVRVWDRG